VVVDTEIGVSGAPPHDEFGLPGGWLLRRRTDPEGLRLELIDPDGSCLAAVTGGRWPAFTIERAWRGYGYGETTGRWWAMAIGRAERRAPLKVTFTGRKPRSTRGHRDSVPGRTVVTPMVVDGLWVAVVPGLQFAVTCRQDTRVNVRHLEPLPVRRASGPRCAEEGAG
jgi:hypothetical protein